MQLLSLQEQHALKTPLASSPSPASQLKEPPASAAAERDWDQDESDLALQLTPSGKTGMSLPIMQWPENGSLVSK